MRHGGLINADVVFIAALEELLSGELCVVVRDNGVRDSKAMDDVGRAFIHFVDLSTVTIKCV